LVVSFAGLDGWLRSRAAGDLFSGVVLIRRGETTVFSGAYGWATRRWAVPISLANRFDTASITKLFTSVAALQLVDQGRLAWTPRSSRSSTCPARPSHLP
jgi:CubicO group peptidase (beta-lactamase class C family)